MVLDLLWHQRRPTPREHLRAVFYTPDVLTINVSVAKLILLVRVTVELHVRVVGLRNDERTYTSTPPVP